MRISMILTNENSPRKRVTNSENSDSQHVRDTPITPLSSLEIMDWHNSPHSMLLSSSSGCRGKMLLSCKAQHPQLAYSHRFCSCK
ncbi:hypothetical protein SK128_021980, partial [Halocaridina rubra]